jgi:hypothetical protein
MATATLVWSQCPGVESVPGKVSGAWVFHVTREQVVAELKFAARSLEAPPPVQPLAQTVDAHSL